MPATKDKAFFFRDLGHAKEVYSWSSAKTIKLPYVWDIIWGDPHISNKDMNVVIQAQAKRLKIKMSPDLTLYGQVRRSIRHIKGLPSKPGPRPAADGPPKRRLVSTKNSEDSQQSISTDKEIINVSKSSPSPSLYQMVLKLAAYAKGLGGAGPVEVTSWLTVTVNSDNALSWERGNKETGILDADKVEEST